jgi:hypothetical protein
VLVGNLKNATAIGYDAIVEGSNHVHIGNTFVTKIGGYVGWSNFSDGRYKKDIKENVVGLQFINSLRPIIYTVNIKGLNEYLHKGTKQVADKLDKEIEDSRKNDEEVAAKIIYNGFIAQEVEQAAKKLNYEFSGVNKPVNEEGLYGLRYSDFVVPLVKAVQELDAENKALQAELTHVKDRLQKLEAILTVNNRADGSYLAQNTPNPSGGTTTIDYYLSENSTSAQLRVTNAQGQLLKQVSLNNRGKGQVTLDTHSFSAGVYHYTLWVDEKIVATRKLVIKR